MVHLKIFLVRRRFSDPFKDTLLLIGSSLPFEILKQNFFIHYFSIHYNLRFII